MNGRTRLFKEARQLQGAWLLVLAAACLSMLTPFKWPFWIEQLIGSALVLGAFVGVPLLASLPLGYEFEHQTFTLLLAQPIDRRRVWREKYIVALAAVVPLALTFALVTPRSQSGDPNFPTIAAAWMLGMCAAAPFWTMVANSTLGGLVLDSAFHILLLGAVMRAQNNDVLKVSPLAIVAYLAYLATMLWLGRALFLRQQAIEGRESENLLSSASDRLLPRFLLSFLHSRANTPTLNLVRRELCLLRPAWVMGLCNVLTWTGLLIFHEVPRTGSHSGTPTVMTFAILLLPITAVLAGSLSLGEEKNWGTHSWHLTLPISVSKQWLIKLLVSAVSGVVCGSLVPLLVLAVGGQFSGNAWMYLQHDLLWGWPLAMGCISVAAFWCSCIVKGTVKAVLFLMAVCLGLALTGAVGVTLSDLFSQKAHGWFQYLFLYVDPFRDPKWLLLLRFVSMQWFLLLVVGFIGLQSYRLFGARRPDSKRAVFLAVLPVLLLIASVTFGVATMYDYILEARYAQNTVFRETHAAIEAFQSSVPSGSPQALTVTLDRLGNAARLSAITRSWLDNNAITLHPHQELSAQSDCCHQFFSYGDWGQSGEPYVAEFRLRNGMQCQLSYRVNRYGALGAECR